MTYTKEGENYQSILKSEHSNDLHLRFSGISSLLSSSVSSLGKP